MTKMTPSLKKQIERTSRILEANIPGPRPKYYWKAQFNPQYTALELQTINYYQEARELEEPDVDPKVIAEEIRASLVDIMGTAEKEVNAWPGVYNRVLAEDKSQTLLGDNHPQVNSLRDALLEVAKKRGFKLF